METINNVTSAASKLIWGESAQADTRTSTNETGGVEPVSGLQGKGTVDEPFDKGNSENPISSQSESHPASNNHGPHTTYAANILDPRTHQDAHDETFGEGADDRLPNKGQHTLAQTSSTSHDSASRSGVHDTPSSTRSNDNVATLPDRTRTHEHDHHHGSAGTEHSSTSTSNTSRLPSTSNHTATPAPNPTSASVGGPPRPEHETDKTGVIGGMSNTSASSSAPPSSSTAHPGAAPSSGAAPQAKQQGAANPTLEPETSGEKSKSKSTLNIDDIDGEEALKKRNPNDHSGEPMKIHGGGGEEFGEKETAKKAVKIEDRRESKAGQEGGQDLGKEEHGTGEQWVKSTGLAAEGGDFDATKPGAGREADRLLEQKGIHKEQPGAPAASTSPSDTKEKVSMGEKIKNKLHIGHKDKP